MPEKLLFKAVEQLPLALTEFFQKPGDLPSAQVKVSGLPGLPLLSFPDIQFEYFWQLMDASALPDARELMMMPAPAARFSAERRLKLPGCSGESSECRSGSLFMACSGIFLLRMTHFNRRCCALFAAKCTFPRLEANLMP
ncbi:hypothetical protein CEW83_19370 [Parazoarcus communis]|uniref:Uncharacterized protein n=1 Tax=Parazoarcus communis TaxID=41977 RepID=A0A2U8GXF1_9RHOO|nr:hypothetical protein CEW83_19370 [Parazoarcus communis]